MIETAILLTSLAAIALLLRWCQTMWLKSTQKKKWVGFIIALSALIIGWAVLFSLKHNWFHGTVNKIIAVIALIYVAWVFKNTLGKVGSAGKN